MTTHNKLVRDLIPTIIEQANKSCTTKILNDEEYIIEVNKKMTEELDEYYEAPSTVEKVEELADLLELIHAAANHLNVSFEDIESRRIKKKQERGGFSKRIFLKEVDHKYE